MSRSRVGLIIAGESKRLDNDTIYSSQRKKLTVDPEPQPPHFDLLENFSGGTKWTAVPIGEYREEYLVRIRHNMPFIPMSYAYFLQTSLPTGFGTTFKAQYSTNISMMLYNAVGVGEEALIAGADETYFYIKHYFQCSTLSAGPQNAYGSDFQFTIRYFIFNLPTFLIPGGQDGSL